MVIKNRFGKVAATTLAVGVLAVVGLGSAGAAFADDGSHSTPPSVQTARTDLPPLPGQRPGEPGPGQNNNRLLPGGQMGPGGPMQGPGGSNGNRTASRPAGPQQRPAPANAQNAEATRAKGVIAASAEVLAVKPESVLASLEQGQTLTQVAAAHGMSRDYFLSELTSQIQKDIKDGQRFGIPASANLDIQLANLVDQAGLGIRGATLSSLY